MTIPIPELVPVKINVLSERTVGIFSMFQIIKFFILNFSHVAD